MFTALLVIL